MSPITVTATGMTPPAPRPWSARNRMSWTIERAAPESAEPRQKSTTATA